MEKGLGQSFQVNNDGFLLSFLLSCCPLRSRTSVKQLLSKGQVLVNGENETAFDRPLLPGDTVTIIPKSVSIARESVSDAKEVLLAAGLAIVFEDRNLLVVDKPAGLPAAPSKEREGTAPSYTYLSRLRSRGGKAGMLAQKGRFTMYSLLNDYVRSESLQNRKEALSRGERPQFGGNRVWLIHRPGRETSGLVIVAKDERTKELMQSKWNTLVLEERFEGQHCSFLRIKHLNTGEIIRFISPLQEG